MKNTENINENTQNLDLLKPAEFTKLYLKEDLAVHKALEKAQAEISKTIELISTRFKSYDFFKKSLAEKYSGPRLFYIGAGTSGRLGILDASECPPTFSAHPEMVQGIIAGGDKAIQSAVEGAEDDEEAGYKIIYDTLTEQDTLVAISASGGAPYVIGALKAGKEKKALRISIANNASAEIFNHCEQKIFLDTGAEILSGSTRLKAGTSQKITLNMISTGLMVQLNKVYSNLMVDLKASNKKLVKRSIRLVSTITEVDEKRAEEVLSEAGFKVKNACIMIKKEVTQPESEEILKKCNGNLRIALN